MYVTLVNGRGASVLGSMPAVSSTLVIFTSASSIAPPYPRRMPMGFTGSSPPPPPRNALARNTKHGCGSGRSVWMVSVVLNVPALPLWNVTRTASDAPGCTTAPTILGNTWKLKPRSGDMEVRSTFSGVAPVFCSSMVSARVAVPTGLDVGPLPKSSVPHCAVGAGAGVPCGGPAVGALELVMSVPRLSTAVPATPTAAEPATRLSPAAAGSTRSASAKASSSSPPSESSTPASASTVPTASASTSSNPSAGVATSPSSSITSCATPGCRGSGGKSAGSMVSGWINRSESAINHLECAVLVREVLLDARQSRLHVHRDCQQHHQEQRELDPVDAPAPHAICWRAVGSASLTAASRESPRCRRGCVAAW